MEAESARLAKKYPFISDHMTVNSLRQKQFWMRAGAKEEMITVTGQPRFDFYKQPERWKKWQDFNIPINTDKQTVLFFSYDVDAYIHPDYPTQGLSWLDLRNETEEILIKLANSGKINVLIKPHPQQNPVDVKRISDKLARQGKRSWGKNLFMIGGAFDTRQLIVNSDIIVGFQTTALIEAICANKKVIYTFWGQVAEQLKDLLIPFHNYPDVFNCVNSPLDLEKMVMREEIAAKDGENEINRQTFINEHLGKIDGQSAIRVLSVVDDFVKKYQLSDTNLKLRQKLRAFRQVYLRKEIHFARARYYGWKIISILLYPLLSVRLTERQNIIIKKSILDQKARIHECLAALELRCWQNNNLIGRTSYTLWRLIREVIISMSGKIIRRAAINGKI